MIDGFRDFDAQACSNAFRVLALGLALPDEEIVDMAAQGVFESEMRDALAVLGIDDGVVTADESVQAADNARTMWTLDALRREYTRLFSAPGGRVVPIWESAFLDPAGGANEFGPMLIRTPQAADAKRRYEAAGVTLSSNESADHMRIECEFACYLLAMSCRECDSERSEAWLEAFRGFSAAHLSKWFLSFCEKVARETRHPFYRELAEFGLSLACVL